MIHGLSFLITALCFCYFDYFLLSDYPNHLAKVHLYNHLSDTHSILSEYYYRNHSITPYMAFNTIVGLFEPLVGIYWAGKIFIIFSLFVTLSGGLFLNDALYNRITPFSLFIHIFMFNFTLSMGFMNFVLGLGLILWGYGLWIRYYNHTLKFYVLFALYAILVFCCHIFALFILGLVIGLYQLSQASKSTFKDFFKSSFYASLKVLSFAILPIFITIILDNQKKGYYFPPHTAYDEDIITNFVLSYVTPLTFDLDYYPALVCITLFMILIVKRKIEFKHPFVISALFLFGLCVPFYVAGVACANERIPAFVGLLFAVSVIFKREDKHIAFCSVIMGICSVFLYVNNINLLHTHNRWVSEFVNTIKDDKNLHGRRLVTVNNKDDVHYHNLSTYANIAGRMLDPALFTHIPHISMYKKYAKIYGCQQSPVKPKELRFTDLEAQKYIEPLQPKEKVICPNNFYWRHWRTDFDYVFWIHPNKKPTDIPNELSVYKKGSFFTLYKINKNNKG
jgi:hypothetical protein